MKRPAQTTENRFDPKALGALFFALMLGLELLHPKTVPIYDDLLHLKLNPFVRDWNFAKILTTSYWQGVESVLTQERPFSFTWRAPKS